MNILEIWWTVSPEIFSIGPISIRWYGLLFALAFVFGYMIMQHIYKLENKSIEDLDKLSIHIILGTVIGARLGHCFFYEPEYYLLKPLEIIKVWQGGLASHGAAIGILISLYIFSKKVKGQNTLWILDRLVIVIALGGALIRLGNLFNSEIFGKPTGVWWAFIFVRVDEVPRHPTQIYESLFYFISSLILYFRYRKEKSNLKLGLNFGLFLILIFGFRIFIEIFKENQSAFEANLPLNMGQLLSIPFVILGAYFLLRRLLSKKTMKNFLALIIVIFSLQSCDRKVEEFDILVTIYPFKFILEELSNKELKIGVLLPGTFDPHTYELAPSDMIKVEKSKLFIYGDKNLDGWAKNIKKNNTIQFSDLIPDSLKLIIKNQEYLIENYFEHNHNDETDYHIGFDPHFWTDPLTINGMLDNILKVLVKNFPDKEYIFKKNAKEFSKKLYNLHIEIEQKSKSLQNKNVFSSHPFYNYFFYRYNFNVVGFLEITPGQNISPKEMKKVMDLVRQKNVLAIFTNKQHSYKTTKILAETLGIKHFDLDPIGGSDELNKYDKIIRYNFNLIYKALK
jgi:prolipoprotein diacylglyceryl transferase